MKHTLAAGSSELPFIGTNLPRFVTFTDLGISISTSCAGQYISASGSPTRSEISQLVRQSLTVA
jgi:hypothetical protein